MNTNSKSIQVNHSASSISVILPFEMTDPATFDERFEAIKSRTFSHGNKNPDEKVWKNVSFNNLSPGLLPHIADLMGVAADEEALKRHDLNEKTATYSFELNKNFINNKKLGLNARNLEWYVKRNTELQPANFLIEGIELCFFDTGIGMLTIKLKPKECDNSIEAWLNMLHYFRFYTGFREFRIRHKPIPSELPDSAKEAMQSDYRLPEDSRFVRLIERIMEQAKIHSIPNSKHSRNNSVDTDVDWYAPVYSHGRMLAWTALIMDHVPEDEDSLIMRKLHHSFKPSQGDDLGKSEQTFEDSEWNLEYGQRKWFFSNLNSAGFVDFESVTSNKGFATETMPNHLWDSYRPLYLLTLHQRFYLQKLSHRVVAWLPISKDLKEKKEQMLAFEELREDFLTFNARWFFHQMHQSTHYHSAYRLFLDTNEIDLIFEEVKNEIEDIHVLLDLQRTRIISQDMNRFGSIIGAAGLVGIPIGFLGINLVGVTGSDGIPVEQAFLWGIGGGITLCVMVWGCYRLLFKKVT